VSAAKLCFVNDLLSSEKRFLAAIREVAFGHFEYVQIRKGEIVLDPWPVAVRDIKFCTEAPAESPTLGACQLKRQIAELFEYTRAIDAGEIRLLEVRHGLPFSMEAEWESARALGGRS
jgi:hypothetical protein